MHAFYAILIASGLVLRDIFRWIKCFAIRHVSVSARLIQVHAIISPMSYDFLSYVLIWTFLVIEAWLVLVLRVLNVPFDVLIMHGCYRRRLPFCSGTNYVQRRP